MGNPLRVVYDNAADRAVLSYVGATSVGFPLSNLKTNSKSESWRTTAGVNAATITATFATPEIISCVALPYCNFSTGATMRVRLYSDTACTVLLRDSGTLSCSLGASSKVAGLTAAQSVSAYSYGGGTSATVWLIRTTGVMGVKIDLTDTANLQGWMDATRLVMGDYYTPQFNAEYGVSIAMEDTSSHYRTDAGNLLTDVGTRNKKLSVNLSFMNPTDRAGMWDLVGYVGKSVPIFISVFPENSDAKLEQNHTVYGKFSSVSALAARDYAIYSVPLEVESL